MNLSGTFTAVKSSLLQNPPHFKRFIARCYKG